MQSCIIIMILCLEWFVSLGQLSNSSQNSGMVKPVIDVNAVKNWPFVSSIILSNDGNYVAYSIENKPIGANTVVIKSTRDKWTNEFKFYDINPQLFFSGDSRQLVIKSSDSLYFVKLNTAEYNKILARNVQFSTTDSIRWIAYHNTDNIKDLLILDLFTNQQQYLKKIKNFWFDKNGNKILLETESTQDSLNSSLSLVNLVNNNVEPIWSGSGNFKGARINMVDFDRDGNQLVFMVDQNSNESEFSRKLVSKSIWYYRSGMTFAEQCVDNYSKGVGPAMEISGYLRFSENGQWILFDLKDLIETQVPKEDAVMVTIWGYKDVILQPEQMRQLKEQSRSNSYTGVVNINDKKVFKIENQHESNQTFKFSGDHVVVGGKWYIEPWWKWDPKPCYYVVSLRNGSRRLLKKAPPFTLKNFYFSPDNKWLIYYDRDEAAYFSFNLETGVIRNITKGIKACFKNEYGSYVTHDAVADVAGWVSKGNKLLLYDNFDIWQVDPACKMAAINITNGYGLKHQLKLRLVNGPESQKRKIVFEFGELLLLTAFSPVNKYNGFFQIILGKKGDPEMLYLGPYTFFRTESQKAHGYSFSDGMQPVKASGSQKYVVMRQSATEPPNYYFTEDFKTYKAISDLSPQKEYNWLTSEIITWKQFDGTVSQGVLYKPENFDHNKKYPLIFNYYEKLSHRLYEFPKPDFTRNNINIPWFVSRGYLVFTPDIHYKVAKESGITVGEYAYNSVVSAAKYLSKLLYVDAKRMGIQGHSFGGLETNYIVTHTNIFAAACEVAGNSDAISAYLTLAPAFSSIEHLNKQTGFELGHEFYGATPWERPELYRKNSAVLSADKITTPLLIMHNEKDNNIPWRQGIELYMALRRLGKKAWMLQYDGQSHSVNGKPAIDFTVRITQFFDHYLKGSLPPKWMTEGVPATLKGIETGYGLDTNGKMP